MRLQKYLAEAGIASRRKAEELITAGKVKVNGKIITELGTKIEPGKDKVYFDGQLVKQQEKKVYMLLNKPSGYVTTMKDPQGRKIVTQLLKGVKERVYPVGRLDYETEGLLLMTNDGDLSYALTHPKHGFLKTYHALVIGIPSQDKLMSIRKGLLLEDGLTSPAQVRILSKIGGNSLLEIQIHEGRNRQVRRMCEKIGHPVMSLKRTQLGFLTLEGIESGQYRFLTKEELEKLKKLEVKAKAKTGRSEFKPKGESAGQEAADNINPGTERGFKNRNTGSEVSFKTRPKAGVKDKDNFERKTDYRGKSKGTGFKPHSKSKPGW